MSSTKFLTVFLIAMIPTYLYRWIFFAGNVAAFTNPAMSGRTQEFINEMEVIFYLLMLGSYIAMTFVSYKRGLESGKGFLFAFPIVAAVFDLILVIVPFVPTIFNILTIIFGLIDGTTKVELDSPKTNNDLNKINAEVQNPSESILDFSGANIKTQSQSIGGWLHEFNGDMSLQNDAYKIFLSKKYNIKNNDLFNKFEFNNTNLFDTLDDALFFAFNKELKFLNEQDNNSGIAPLNDNFINSTYDKKKAEALEQSNKILEVKSTIFGSSSDPPEVDKLIPSAAKSIHFTFAGINSDGNPVSLNISENSLQRGLVLGRDPNVSDAQINDKSVSRRHAKLQYDSGVLKIRDLGSTNGTWVNDVRLGTESAILRAGQSFNLGQVSLQIKW